MNKLMFLFAFGFCLFTTHCGSSNQQEKVKITILGESATSIQSMIALENEYEFQNKSVDLVFKPNSFDDAFNKANQDFANGTGIYDIVMQYNFSLSSFVQNQYVYPIDELIKDVPDSLKSFESQLFPAAWKEVGFYYKNYKKTSEGVMKVGYPFTTNTMFIVYNKHLFEDVKQQKAFKAKYKQDLNVPQTWEDFAKVAEFFTQPQQQNYGVCLQGATGSWLYYEWMNFLFGMGGRVMDKQHGWEGDVNTKILLNTPEALAALNLYKSLKPYNAGNFTNVDAYEQIKIIKEKNVAMAIIWSDLAYSLVSKGNGVYDDKFGFAPIPGGKSLLAGGSYFINKKSKNPKMAAKYIIDLMQPNIQLSLAKKGLCSPLKSVYDHPDVKRMPYSSTLKSSLERGVYMLEAGIDATMISEKITTYLQKTWNGELGSEDALKRMQQEIESERIKIFKEPNKS